jgi:hypothetical protein
MRRSRALASVLIFLLTLQVYAVDSRLLAPKINAILAD